MDNIPAIDWEDIVQIIKTHISKKWHLWDQDRAFKPWVNAVISSQLKNQFRNNYGNYRPPCAKCPFNEGASVEDGDCEITSDGMWGVECPIYAKWAARKKHAWNIKIPASLENHDNEVIAKQSLLNVDLEGSIDRIHEKMEEALSPKRFKIYKMLYIDHMDKEEVALKLGYKSSEKNRKAGYKQLKNMEKIFVEEVRGMLEEGLI